MKNKLDLVPIDSLNPAAYNPRISDPQRLDLIELSLRKLGFVLPVYATADGEILSGHQRQMVALRMGVKQLPRCLVPDMTDGERKAINIAFNRGTNDLAAGDRAGNLTEALTQLDIETLGKALPDLDINPHIARRQQGVDVRKLDEAV